MRFRSVLIYLWPLLLLSVSTVSAQKRVVATVNPNAEALNSSADIFDPQTGTFTPVTGKLNVPREQHAAVTLGGGKVLIAGGYNDHYLKTAELFDPATGLFTSTDNSMIKARAGAAAVLLQGGTVLIVGGFDGSSYLSSAETYDPAEKTFTGTSGSLATARYQPVATQLNTGQILITGGFNGAFLGSAEIFDPAKRTFAASARTMSDTRQGHTATLLSNGKVLVTGGCTNAQSDLIRCDKYLASADIYDPETDTFTATGAMKTARAEHSAILLSDGRVLIAGGKNESSVLNAAEIYDPGTGKFTDAGSMSTPRIHHTATILSDGTVLVAGGYSNESLSSAEIFDPKTGAFTALPSQMSVARSRHAAAELDDHRILLTGGEKSDLLLFDVNFHSTTDNIPTNIAFSPDSKRGFVSYTGSGTVLAFSAENGAVLKKIKTGGKPTWITPLDGGTRMAVVSALDNQIFVIDSGSLEPVATYFFPGLFSYGSVVELSPDGVYGYVSSAGTGEVVKFETSSGKEVGRLKGLQTPAQITVTKDGSTLIIVDTGANKLVFANASSMTAKDYGMRPFDDGFTSASFTIAHRAVLNSDQTEGLVASADGFIFAFNPSTGKINHALLGGSNPGFTTLMGTGAFWLVLCNGSLSIIPTWDSGVIDNSTDTATPLHSANMVIQPDQRFALYSSGDTDRILQHDFITGAVVGSYPVGDDPNDSVDQSSSLAFTPDLKTLAVVNYASNELNLLTDATLLMQTKFVSEQEKFTGISVVNLSEVPANLKIAAISDFGSDFSATGIQNPVTVQLNPNTQMSVDVSQLFNLDTDETNSGYLTILSDQPSVTGFSNTGQIHSDYLHAYLNNVQGIPLHTDVTDELHDFIIPEIPQVEGTSAELNFVNPNYNTSNFDVTHYGTDGTVLETKSNFSVSGANRQTKKVSDLVTTTQSGQALIVGGYDSESTKNSAELFSLSSGTFTATGTLVASRQGHSSTLLRNEKVLIAGGKAGSVIQNSAEIYDPISSKFTASGATMNVERYRHTATLLPDGKVLLAGGQNSYSINNTAELYDPLAYDSNGTFEYTQGSMSSPRDAHTATLLNNGKVLITGGLDGTGTSATAELYDPATSTFSATGTMHDARAFHTAVLLSDGKVLIAGGYNGSYLSSAEIYDPETGIFTVTPSMASARSQHTATRLSNGTVLIAGGISSSGPLGSAEIYDPASGGFLPALGKMTSARLGHTASLVQTYTTSEGKTVLTEKVMLAGGNDGTATLSKAELYNPATRQFSATPGEMNAARQGHSVTVLNTVNQGYLRAKSKNGLLFTEIYSNGGGDAAINGINVEKFAGIKKIYSPQFAILPDYVTMLNIINANQDSQATVTLTLHAPDGTVLSKPLSLVVPKNGQVKGDLLALFGNDSSLANKTGWVEVSSSVDRIVGTISFTNANRKFLAGFELSGKPMSNFLLPLVSEDTDYTTGIALLNSGDADAHVRMELWEPSGTMEPAATFVLPAHTQVAKPVAGFFPGTRGHLFSNIRISSDQPLYGFGVLYSLDLHFISSVPAVPYPGR